MAKHSTAEFHPREIELANYLKTQNLECEVRAGEWFLTDMEIHVVLEIEKKEGQTFVTCQHGDIYNTEDVIFMPHLSDCRDWLADREYELKFEDAPEGRMKAVAHRIHTEMKVEKTEPTDLSATFAVMIEIINIIDFGGM